MCNSNLCRKRLHWLPSRKVLLMMKINDSNGKITAVINPPKWVRHHIKHSSSLSCLMYSNVHGSCYLEINSIEHILATNRMPNIDILNCRYNLSVFGNILISHKILKMILRYNQYFSNLLFAPLQKDLLFTVMEKCCLH